MTTRRSVIASAVRVFAAATLILGIAAVNTASATPGGQNFVSIFHKYNGIVCYYDLAQPDGHGADHQAEMEQGLAYRFFLFTFTGEVAPMNQMDRLQIRQCAWETWEIL